MEKPLIFYGSAHLLHFMLNYPLIFSPLRNPFILCLIIRFFLTLYVPTNACTWEIIITALSEKRYSHTCMICHLLFPLPSHKFYFADFSRSHYAVAPLCTSSPPQQFRRITVIWKFLDFSWLHGPPRLCHLITNSIRAFCVQSHPALRSRLHASLCCSDMRLALQMALSCILPLWRVIHPPSDSNIIKSAAAYAFIGRNINSPFGTLLYWWRCRTLFYWKEVFVPLGRLILIIGLLLPPSFEKAFIAVSCSTLLIAHCLPHFNHVWYSSHVRAQLFLSLCRARFPQKRYPPWPSPLILWTALLRTPERLLRSQVHSRWNRR